MHSVGRSRLVACRRFHTGFISLFLFFFSFLLFYLSMFYYQANVFEGNERLVVPSWDSKKVGEWAKGAFDVKFF